ncbi:MAG: hypothetical protein RDU76_11100 [Candidatus Edwardsbacteria bacterium]|nr:hypothetical protein [Candidatus Edwardsbacteria bacterium]
MAMNNEIILLTDYRNYFYSSQKHKDASMNLAALNKYFLAHGYSLNIKRYSVIDLRKENYNGKFILYQSSEDRDLFYKSYIEDILLGIQLQGGILIPDFYKFRAHHNKVFMEILRDISDNEEIKNIRSKYFGCYEEFKNKIDEIQVPIVVKPAEGAVSKGIRLFNGIVSLKKYTEKLSRSFNALDIVKNEIKSITRNYHVRQSNHRRKFIIQNFVSGLKNDYKIVIYGAKYYILFRKNRKNDFRASGSGLFEFKKELPGGLLDYAQRVFLNFHCPYIAMDVGYDGHKFYLIEFQFLHFGTFTLESAPFYFLKENNEWKIIQEKTILEQELANSVDAYITNIKG